MKAVTLVEAFRFLTNGLVKVVYPAVVEVSGEECCDVADSTFPIMECKVLAGNGECWKRKEE